MWASWVQIPSLRPSNPSVNREGTIWPMGIQGAQMVATLAKGVDFQRGKTGLLNEFSR